MVSELQNEFDFDDDEKDHYQDIEEEMIETLHLANTASIIALNGLSLLDSALPPITIPPFRSKLHSL
jgi:hypothetical protein